jgi:hypothetical protein
VVVTDSERLPKPEVYQKRSEQSEQKMNNSPCSSRRSSGAAIPAGDGKARLSRDTSHGLHWHPEGKSLFVTPDGNHINRILGCGPAGLRRGRDPLGKCSTCDVLPANLKVKVGGDEMETESDGYVGMD